MNRDPRHAYAERIIGAMTASVGAGSVVLAWTLGWESGLLRTLAGDKWAIYLLVTLFGSVGLALHLASRLWDTRLRCNLLYGCAALWSVAAIGCWIRQLPIALSTAVVIIYYCIVAARSLRRG